MMIWLNYSRNLATLVRHQLKLPTKATDTSLQKCQKLLVAAVCALIQATTKASDDLKIPLTHSLVLALSGNWEFNQKRRDLLRPHLHSQYAALCNPSTSISTELFGDDIGEGDRPAHQNQSDWP